MTVEERAREMDRLAQRYLEMIRGEADDRKAKVLLLQLMVDARREGD